MAKKFAALAGFRNQKEQPPDERTTRRTDVQAHNATVSPGKAGRPPGKRSNPDYERVTVLLQKQTRKAASRLWEDTEPDKDLSDLIQKLLADWVKLHG